MGRRANSGTPISFFSFQDIITTVTGILLLITLMLALDLSQSKTQDHKKSASPVYDLSLLIDEKNQLLQSLSKSQSRLTAITKTLEELGNTKLVYNPSSVSDSIIALDQTINNKILELNNLKHQKSDLVLQRNDLSNKLSDNVKTASANQIQADEVLNAPNVKLLPGLLNKRPIIIDCSSDNLRIGKYDSNGNLKLVATLLLTNAIDEIGKMCSKSDPNKEYFVVYVRAKNSELASDIIPEIQRKNFDVGWDILGNDQRLFGK